VTVRPPSLSFVKVSADSGQPPDVNGDGGNVAEVETEDTEQEIVVHVVKPRGTGLGISIAGGVGATPFRGDDEVCYLAFCYSTRCLRCRHLVNLTKHMHHL